MSETVAHDPGVEIRSTFLPVGESPVDYHHDALDYWGARRNGRFAPAWSDVSLMDFPPRVIPMISVTDIQADPLASCYRFWGTALTKVYGGDFTGRSPHEVPPRRLGMSIDGGCGRLVQDRNPHLEVKEFVTQRGVFGRALALRLPLTEDGETVHNGLNIYYFESSLPGQPLSAFFDAVFSKLKPETLDV